MKQKEYFKATTGIEGLSTIEKDGRVDAAKGSKFLADFKIRSEAGADWQRLLRITLLVFMGLILGGAALAYEEPSYTTVKTNDVFELRQYDPYIVAEVHASGNFDEIGSQAFRKLFRFISEDDRPQGKISMTVPVLQQPLPDKAGPDSYRFAFVLPAKYNLDELPKTDDVTVQIRSEPSRLLAAHRYSGTWSQELYRVHEKILLDALDKAGITTVGKPIFARYNAPFSLWFLRRNEVLIEVVPPLSR